MIETKVPQDIKKYKTKVIGPLTTRQLLCVAFIIVADILLYKYVISKYQLSSDTIFWIYFILDIIPVGIGWLNPMGLAPETVIKSFLVNFFFSPSEKKHRVSEFQPITVEYTKKELKESKKRMKDAYKKGTLNPPVKYEAKR